MPCVLIVPNIAPRRRVTGHSPELQHRARRTLEIEGGGLLALRGYARLVVETFDSRRLTRLITEVVGLRDGFFAAAGVTTPVGACRHRVHAVAEVPDVAGVPAAGEQQRAGKDHGLHPQASSASARRDRTLPASARQLLPAHSPDPSASSSSASAGSS